MQKGKICKNGGDSVHMEKFMDGLLTSFPFSSSFFRDHRYYQHQLGNNS